MGPKRLAAQVHRLTATYQAALEYKATCTNDTWHAQVFLNQCLMSLVHDLSKFSNRCNVAAKRDVVIVTCHFVCSNLYISEGEVSSAYVCLAISFAAYKQSWFRDVALLTLLNLFSIFFLLFASTGRFVQLGFSFN